MGKRLIQQARGKGGPRYKTPSHRFKADIKYMDIHTFKKGGIMQVIDIIADPVRSAPIAKMMTEDFQTFYILAPNGIMVGDIIEFGESIDVSNGNILPIENIVEGTSVYNLEIVPGDGGKLVRSSGISAQVISQDSETQMTIVRMPSKRRISIKWGCRATVGSVAGAGRTEKPFVKAGNKYKDKRSRGKLYPITSPVGMNAQDHPFGGRTSIGRSSSSKRNAPPGQKVGHIAPKRTGVRRTRAKEQK
jgi:large subunit ribosomal protein L2